MKFYLFLFIFISSFSFAETNKKPMDPTDHFNQGLSFIQKKQYKKARPFLTEYLKTNPKSLSARFNLAFSFYQEGKLNEQSNLKEQARAYFRQILFENPLHSPTRQALKELADKKYFWLWLPADLFLALMALSAALLVWALFKKRFLKLGIFFFLITHGVAGFYFYHRIISYGTLIQDCPILSAPDPKASQVVEESQGNLIKILSKKQVATGRWLSIQGESGLKGWLPSNCVLAVKIFEY